MYYWKFMRMMGCFDALVLMSIRNQDMHGCMKNENWRDGARNQRDVELYTRKIMSRPSRACLAGDIILSVSV